MMGRSHAASGWCIGLVLAPVLGLARPAEVLMFAVATAGFALLPDLDCDGSRATRILGPITGGISWGLQRLSAVVYRATRSPLDRHRQGTHRHLSHTLAFALLLGGAVTLGAVVVGPWFVLGVLAFGVVLAKDALGHWTVAGRLGWWLKHWVVLVVAAATLALVATTNVVAALVAVGGWIGPAVAIGCATHCLGDAPTRSGCPFLWPVPIRGRAWYEISLPRQFRFTTGAGFETKVAYRVFVAMGVLLLPGVIPLMWSLVP